jgi:hypothetical protein
MDTIGVWKYRIQRALALQENMHSTWEQAVDLFNCVYFEKEFGGMDVNRVDVHFANWYISNLIPLVYFRDPFLFIKAKHERYDDFADTMEKVVNYYWMELGLKQEFKRCILSGFLMPPGWIKIGYTAKIGQDIAKIEEIKNKNLTQTIKDTVLGIFREKKEDKSPEAQGILNEYIKEENIFAVWIPSWNMLMPEGYHNVSKMPYLIEIEDMPLIDFMANPLYKNKNGLKPSRQMQPSPSPAGVLNKPSYARSFADKDDSLSIIRLFHIEDRRTNKRYTLSLEADEMHFEGEMVCPEGFSYEPLYFEETLPSKDKANPYPPNVLQPILPQIIEQSMARTQMAKHRKRSSAIILGQRGLANEEDIGQMEDTEQVQLILVSNLAAFQMSQTPALPQDVFKIDDIIKEDLQMGTNMGQLMFAPMPGQRTATQAQIGQSGLQLKASARVDVVEDFTVRIARKIAQFAWWFLPKEKIEEIIGDKVTDKMWPPLPDDYNKRKILVQAELELRIDAGSTAPPKDETVDRKQLLDLASIISTIAPEIIKKNEFVLQLLKRFKYAKDLSKMVFTNDPEEIQVAMLENELMAQNIPQVVGPNENHFLHIGVHQQSPPNQIKDQHILKHGQYAGLPEKQLAGNAPQKGDIRPPIQTSNPEIVRQGFSEGSDIMQAAQNLGVGTGKEAI